MKSLKAAAVVAGSMLLAGAASPAFAQDTAEIPSSSVDGAWHTLTSGRVSLADAMPFQHQSTALDTENRNSLLHTVNDASDTLNSRTSLLGGMPL
ncbi:hypothetical protein [Streptomyces glaucescens]|uniref:Putative secreted protein n=1 Tax=Streptomyces glaucescens TaxID=1907 RepID=A0A089YXV3_STRGA|nr:hypothetical protein [Streptomyces glaucescens]AIR98455.1 putative secreted protein [Streptomyces glaucescens]